MAMVLHELVTNAAKYGALSAADGRVSVRWMHRPHERTPGLLCIHWQESGGPNVAPQIRSGYGTSVIRDMIPFSLSGAVDLAHAPGGVRCRLEIPDHWLVGGAKPGGVKQPIVVPIDPAPPFLSKAEPPFLQGRAAGCP